MVGVPGRSKGCITCRRRRKGCDLERPTCAQCKNHGLICAGYETERVFVVSTPSARQARYSVPMLSWRRNGKTCVSSSWQQGNNLHQVSSNTTSTNFRLLSRPEDERRCINLFWEAYFPSGRPIPSDVIRSYTCTWTKIARNLYQEVDSLRYALWANSLLLTGRRYGETWMMREGTKLYGKALTGMRRSLGMSQGTKRDASIATVKLLSMFEALSDRLDGESPSDGSSHNQPSLSWNRHHAGELALFVARTPGAHIAGDAHHIYADERAEMALSAILQREKQFPLSNPEWKTIPFQHIPKNLKDVLIDILVDMPDLVRDFDVMRHCYYDPTRQFTLRQNLIQKCLDHDRQLLDWFGQLSQLLPKPPLTKNMKLVDFCARPPPGLEEEDLVTQIAQVHGMAFCWTTSLVLYSIFSIASGPEAQLPERMNPIYHARKLVHAIGILLDFPKAGLYGQCSAALPLDVALEFISMCKSQELDSSSSRDSEEVLHRLKWLKQELERGLVAESRR